MSRRHFGFLISLLFREQKTCTPTMAVNLSTESNRNKFLIVGLGNHQLPSTRHNIGMMFVDRLAAQLNARWINESKRCKGYVTSCFVSDDVELVLLKPKEPMNLNGTSVYKTALHYKISPENVYIVQDELDRSLGRISIKSGGSSRGHNGVKSVMNSLKTDAFLRVKLGIDRPVSREPDVVADYVLSEFTTEEKDQVDQIIPAAVKSLQKHLIKVSGADIQLGPNVF
ncbi:peptidyl-tRNA hydrolase [Patella vulgata]|uniref:peptidyl-tRNA hydrolase n=1 Tax=Patella vulgata TaxID=6465 RepID=UPI0021800DBB|nr:peptidyl-tRNA hydrolase [Patella vulgata]